MKIYVSYVLFLTENRLSAKPAIVPLYNEHLNNYMLVNSEQASTG